MTYEIDLQQAANHPYDPHDFVIRKFTLFNGEQQTSLPFAQLLAQCAHVTSMMHLDFTCLIHQLHFS